MHIDLKKATLENDYFRRVIYTDKLFQVVLMSIEPNDEVGMESHPHVTQFVYVVSGNGVSVVGDDEFDIYPGVGFVVPFNTPHNIINNSSKTPLKFYTTYTPPEHKPKTKAKKNPRH